MLDARCRSAARQMMRIVEEEIIPIVYALKRETIELARVNMNSTNMIYANLCSSASVY